MDREENKVQRIFLTGFMGSGKSTIGRQLAAKLKWFFIDSDEWIESQLGREIKNIFKVEGENWFRLHEEESLQHIINSSERTVISLGGGTLISEQNLKRVLAAGVLIYIQSSPMEIWRRIRHSTRRPLLRAEGEKWNKETYLKQIEFLLKARETGYLKAQKILNRDGLESTQIVEQIVAWLAAQDSNVSKQQIGI